jgi:hypothetical protein
MQDDPDVGYGVSTPLRRDQCQAHAVMVSRAREARVLGDDSAASMPPPDSQSFALSWLAAAPSLLQFARRRAEDGISDHRQRGRELGSRRRHSLSGCAGGRTRLKHNYTTFLAMLATASLILSTQVGVVEAQFQGDKLPSGGSNIFSFFDNHWNNLPGQPGECEGSDCQQYACTNRYARCSRSPLLPFYMRGLLCL